MYFNPLCLQHLQFTFMWDIGQKFDLYGKILNIWLKNMIILPALVLDSIYIFKIRSHLHIISWVHENSFDYTLYFRINVFLFHTFIRFEIWKVILFFLLFKNVFWQESDQIWVPMLFYIGSCWKEVYFCSANMYSSSSVCASLKTPEVIRITPWGLLFHH